MSRNLWSVATTDVLGAEPGTQVTFYLDAGLAVAPSLLDSSGHGMSNNAAFPAAGGPLVFQGPADGTNVLFAATPAGRQSFYATSGAFANRPVCRPGAQFFATDTQALYLGSLANTWVESNGALVPVVLTSAAAHIPTDVALPISATTTILTTSSLAIGTWVVNVGALVGSASAPTADCDLILALGTATATIAGQYIATADIGSVAAVASKEQVSLTAIVTVTVAGTLLIRGVNADAAVAYAAYAAGSGSTTVGATGYSAVKIA